MNKAIIIGNLGRDPELKQLGNGNAVCNFSVATNRKWKDRATGTMKEEVEWHRIVVWGKTAENCNRYLSKGRQVAVEGRLQTREWQDKEGNTRRTTEIVAYDVQFLSGGEPGGGRRGAPSPPANSGAFDESFDDSEIPF